MIKYEILQSGFLCRDSNKLFLTQELKPDITSIIIKPYKNTLNKYHYAKNLTSLINEYLNNDMIITSYDFRHKFLLEFFDTIQEISFKSWIYAQAKSTMISTIHLSFLKDTFNFILGNNRTMDISNWDGLTEASLNDMQEDNVMKLLECYFGDRTDSNIYIGPTLPPTLTDVICLWTSRTAGFRDFILTCDCIFGNKKRIEISSSGYLAGSDSLGQIVPDITFNNRG